MGTTQSALCPEWSLAPTVAKRHSDGGVVKAIHTQKDIKSMRRTPLSFGEQDVQSIRAGLAERTDTDAMITVYPAQ